MPNEIGTIIGPACDEGGDSALALCRDADDTARVHVFYSIAQGLAVMDRYRDGTDPEFWDGLRTCLLASDLAEASAEAPVEIGGAAGGAICGAIVNAPELWSDRGAVLITRRYQRARVQQVAFPPMHGAGDALYVLTDEESSRVLVMYSKAQVREMTERYRHCFAPKLLMAVRAAIHDASLPDISATPAMTVEGSAASIIALAFEINAARGARS